MMAVGLQAAHGLVATMTQTPEMNVNDSEANMLAKPLVLLMDHYSVVPPPEVALWINVITAIGYVELPRFALIRMRKAEERAARMKPVYDSSKPLEPDPAGFAGGMPFGSSAN